MLKISRKRLKTPHNNETDRRKMPYNAGKAEDNSIKQKVYTQYLLPARAHFSPNSFNLNKFFARARLRVYNLTQT